MTISEYMSKHRMDDVAFTNFIGIHRTTIHRWLTGETHPQRSIAEKIVKKTEGAITMADIYR